MSMAWMDLFLPQQHLAIAFLPYFLANSHWKLVSSQTSLLISSKEKKKVVSSFHLPHGNSSPPSMQSRDNAQQLVFPWSKYKTWSIVAQMDLAKLIRKNGWSSDSSFYSHGGHASKPAKLISSVNRFPTSGITCHDICNELDIIFNLVVLVWSLGKH